MMIRSLKILLISLLFFQALPDRGASAQRGYRQLREAQIQFQKRNYEKAEKMCRRALVQDPGLYPAYNILGAVYARKKGSEQQAISYFRKSLSIAPDQPVLYSQLADIYNRIGEHEKALRSLKKAFSLQPDNFQINFNLGLMYLLQKRAPHKAVEYLERAVGIDPDHERLNFLAGFTHLLSGNKAEALEYITRLRELKNEYLATRLENAIRQSEKGEQVEVSEAMKDTSVPREQKQEQQDNSGTSSEKAPDNEGQKLSVGHSRTRTRASGKIFIKQKLQPKKEQ